MTCAAGSTPRLVSCVARGDVEGARTALSGGADVAARDRQGWTLLILAARFSRVPMVRFLLDHGADVHATARVFQVEGRTALHCAAKAGHAAVADLLLEHGAAVEARDAKEWTPLFSADHVAVAEVLVRHGADVHVRTSTGETPLHWVAATARTDVARFLLDQGVEVDPVRSPDGWTPLFAACGGWERLADVSLLVERGADPGRLAADGSTLLHVASFDPLVNLLLDRGAEAEARRADGRTPLHQAALRRKVAAVQVLLQRGSSAAVVDHEGSTPLHLLALPCPEEAWPSDTPDIAKALIAAGADLRARDAQGRTPLDRAEAGAMGGLADLLRAAALPAPPAVVVTEPAAAPVSTAAEARDEAERAQRRARLNQLVDADDRAGAHALILAEPGGADGARVLLQAGESRLWAPDWEDSPSWFRAVWKGQAQALRLFLECGAAVDAITTLAVCQRRTALFGATLRGDVATAGLLLDAGAAVDPEDEQGWTPLFLAQTGDMVRLLIGRGADSRRRLPDGSTLFQSSALLGHLDVLSFLLDEGADIDAPDGTGRTPLLLAVSRGETVVVRLLIERGADVHRREASSVGNGRSALHLAQSGEVAALLIDRGVDVDDIQTIGDGGETPLQDAADSDRVDVVRVLLERGADPHALVNDLERGPQPSPLHGAASRSRTAIAQLLLEAGADVNARWRGITPLHDAAEFEAAEPAFLELLLQHGADPTALDYVGRTPLAIAHGIEGSRAGRVLKKVTPAASGGTRRE